MKNKFAAVALLMSASLCCSDSFGHDLLHRMLGRDSCGGCDAAPTCCDTPAPACGGRTFSINITLPGRGILAGLRNPGGGCGSLADDCGCNAAPVADCGCNAAPVADCGCDTGSASGGLLSGLFQGVRCGGCGLFKGGIGDGCGCDLMETTPCQDACSSCGEIDACGCGGGLLKGRLLTGRLRGRVSGLFSRFGCGAPAGSDCGCESFASDCGCGSTTGDCGCGRRLSLRDRFHGSRIVGSRGSYSQNNGCNSPCPNSGCGGACGTGDCGCSGGTSQVYDPAYSSSAPYETGAAQPYDNSNSVIASPMVPTESSQESLQREPATPSVAPSVEGDIVVPGAEGAYNSRKPLVDPSAFIIRNAGYRN